MKATKMLLVILSIAMLTACGSSTPKTDVHTHDESCEHNHDTDSSAHHQESFTVEVDTAHNHKAHEENAHHEHKHADGKTHKH